MSTSLRWPGRPRPRRRRAAEPVGVTAREREVVHRRDDGEATRRCRSRRRARAPPAGDRCRARVVGSSSSSTGACWASALARTRAGARRRTASRPGAAASRRRSSSSITSATASRSASDSTPSTADVRSAAEHHVVDHRDRRPGRRCLRHERDAPGAIAPARRALDRGAVEPDAARRSATMPASARSSVDLPAPFGPMIAEPLARRRRRGRASTHDRVPVELSPSPRRPRAAVMARPLRLVRSTTRKNGAPKNAVTTPIGISAGRAACGRARRRA